MHLPVVASTQVHWSVADARHASNSLIRTGIANRKGGACAALATRDEGEHKFASED